MRHKRRVKTFGRDKDGREALMRNLIVSLVEHERIQTTLSKAKELRRHAERAVTIGKRATPAARMALQKRVTNKKAIAKLLKDLSSRFKDRKGGYTRIIKLGPRAGDGAAMALIEWVDYDGVSGAMASSPKTKKTQDQEQTA